MMPAEPVGPLHSTSTSLAERVGVLAVIEAITVYTGRLGMGKIGR